MIVLVIGRVVGLMVGWVFWNIGFLWLRLVVLGECVYSMDFLEIGVGIDLVS